MWLRIATRSAGEARYAFGGAVEGGGMDDALVPECVREGEREATEDLEECLCDSA